VDTDGNEVGGIPLPDIAVPVGTHLGWNLRDPETGAPEQQMSMQGTTRFFAATRKDREAASDPRASIEERYADRDDYIAKATEHAHALVADGYLLDEDMDLAVANAAERYDVAVG